MRRRQLLAIAGTAIPASLGGCLDSDSDETDKADGAGADVDEPEPQNESENEPSSTDAPTNETTDEGATDWPSEPYADYETTEVEVRTPGGDLLGAVTAAVAETRDQRYLGLSDAESLPEDGGMLFVFDSPGERTFVMRRMDFGIDIVYADADGTITTIHHAPEPGPDEDGNEHRYPGYGQYVLEVTYRWTERHGVEEDDVLDFEL